MKVLMLLILLTFSSCAQRIKVPINRMISPQVIGRGALVEYREMGYSSGILDFSNNSTSNALIMGTSNDKEFYFAAGVSNNTDLFIRVPEESSSLLGIKVQVLGEPLKADSTGHNVAFTMGLGNERDKFENVFSIDLKSEVTDFSLIYGFKPNPAITFYGGASLSHYEFEGTISGTTGLDSNNISYNAENIMGGHAGIILGGQGLQLKLELAAQKIKWTNTQEKLFSHFGMSLNANW